MTRPSLLTDALRAARVCDLVTTGRTSGRPRTVELWFAAVENRVYVLAGGREQAHWVRNLAAEPVVRVRIGDRLFEGRARAAEGSDDDRAARAAIGAKYGTRGLESWLRESLPIAIDLERQVS